MFANSSQALRQASGKLKSASKSVAPAAQPAGNALGNLSNRKRKRLINDAVDAHERLSAIDTAHHGQRTQQNVDATTQLANAGHHNIQITTPHGSVTAQSKPRDYTGTSSSSADNGASQGPSRTAATQGGYYSFHNAHNEIAAGSNAPQRNHTGASIALGSSPRPILALPAGSATVYDKPAGQRPGTSATEPKKPFTATAKGEVLKPGQKPLNLKTPDGPERTFTVGKQGPLHTRETTPGAIQAPIAKTAALKTPYDGPGAGISADDTKKKTRARKKKVD